MVEVQSGVGEGQGVGAVGSRGGGGLGWELVVKGIGW